MRKAVLLEYLKREIHLAKWSRNLDPVHRVADLGQHLPGDGDSFRHGVLARLVVGLPHPLQNGLGNHDARDFVGEEFSVPSRDQRPDSSHDWDADAVDFPEESIELRHVEYGLRDGEFCSRFDLEHEALQLDGGIDRGWIAADTDCITSRF